VTARDRIALTVIVSLALLGACWFLLLGPKRSEATKLGRQVQQQQTRLQTARQTVAAAQQARASYPANYAAVALLGKAVPADDDVPSLLYQLDHTAKANDADFRLAKLMAATSGASPQPAAPAGGQPGAAPSGQPAGGSQPAATGTPSAPAPASQGATATLPPGGVVGPAGLATMPFSFRFEGTFFRLSDFFGGVERYIAANNRQINVSGRLLTLNGIGVVFTREGFPPMRAMVSATGYVLPNSEGLTNGATPSTPPQGGAQPVGNPGGGAPPTAPATVVAP
jgi:hypothetical protein